MMTRKPALLLLLAGALLLPACSDSGPAAPPSDRPFIEGTRDNAQIGVVVNSTGNALRLIQLGEPEEAREVALGASNAVTPTRVSTYKGWIAVPLGNAASVAIVEAATQRIDRFFLFPSGNATGSAFTADGALLAANLIENEVGRVTLDQSSSDIDNRVDVAPKPTDIEIAGGRALVVSGNLDENYAPLGPGIVTALDAGTLAVLGTVETGGDNPNDAAVGPDGLLYVVNTGNYVDPGTMAIIDPATLTLVDVVQNVGVGPGSITIDDDGLAYISGFYFGTLVYDTRSRNFVRGSDNPVCAPLSDGSCRGASSAAAAGDGTVYQTFFGSPSQGLSPWVFVYEANTYALTDSIASGLGPSEVRITTFTN